MDDNIKQAIADAQREQDDADLRTLLALPQGRRFLGVLIYEMCGQKRLSLTESLASTAANEGGRNIGLQLLANIERVDFKASLTIQLERENERVSLSLQAEQAEARVEESRPPPMTGSQPLDDHG